MYNRSLSQTEINTNYAAGIPNSPPFVYPVVVSGYADTFVNFTLSAYDFDVSQNFSSATPLTITVTSLPSKGTLYRYMDTTLSWVTVPSAPTVISIDGNTPIYRLGYMPPPLFFGNPN